MPFQARAAKVCGSEGCVTKVSPGEVSVDKLRAHYGTPEIRAGEGSFAEVRIEEDCTTKISVEKKDVLQVRIGKKCFPKVGALQERVLKTRLIEVRASEVATSE